MQKLFGTDGIRARAGEFPLDKQTIEIIGASLARHFAETLGRKPRFVTGRDTRESGDWIESIRTKRLHGWEWNQAIEVPTTTLDRLIDQLKSGLRVVLEGSKARITRRVSAQSAAG